MSTPNPVPPPPPGVVPSSSTTATAIGGAVASLSIMALARKGITFPAGAESALAVLVATVAGYLPSSGRK
jgi:hypothetical protein